MAVADYQKSKDKRAQKKQESLEKKRQEQQAQKSDRNVLKEYQKKAPPLELGNLVKWRISTLRIGRGGNKIARRINSYVENLTWEDVGPVLKGSLTLHMPEGADRSLLRDGDIIKVEVKTGGGWREVWRMRVWEIEINLPEGLISCSLSDDFENLAASKASFSFKRKKKGAHRRGWLASEIVAYLAHEFRFRLGRIVRTKRYINDLTMHKSSPLDAIIKAYKLEKEDTGRSYVMRWKDGRLNITRLRRAPYLYSLRDEIIDAVIQHARPRDFCTALILRANIENTKSKSKDKKHHKRDKLEVKVANAKAIARYGYIVHEESLDSEVKDRTELLTTAKRRLAKLIRTRTDNEITLSHPGIPWVRRGDAVRINLPEFGFRDKPRPWRIYRGGNWSILFVKSAIHNLSAGSYTMDLEFGIEDPIAKMKEDIREARDKDTREEKRKARKEKNKAKEAR